MKSEIFTYLLIGLAKYFEGNRAYPYPLELSISLNHLSRAMLTRFPHTMKGLLDLFSQPLSEWWPSEMPDGFDANSELVFDNELSMGVYEYLDRFYDGSNLPRGADVSTLQTAADNRVFADMIYELQQIWFLKPAEAQREYITLRKFLIENPWTTTLEILDTFGSMHYIQPEHVGALYDHAFSRQESHLYKNEEGKEGFWNCPQCGILQVISGQRKPIKPSVCGFHCPTDQSWEFFEIGRTTRILKRGIHLRTFIPGILELHLYYFLLQLRNDYPTIIEDVHLWPGIDRYDLQIRFSDSVWAVDVKDYKDPFQLSRELRPIFREGNLKWDKAFFVFPTYREHQRPNYRQVLEREHSAAIGEVKIKDSESFKRLVQQKIETLATEKKRNV